MDLTKIRCKDVSWIKVAEDGTFEFSRPTKQL
jgi:hypothetical protein